MATHRLWTSEDRFLCFSAYKSDTYDGMFILMLKKSS